MKLNNIPFEGVSYLAPPTFKFLYDTVAEYKSYCGAGDGIGDKIVPEYIHGKKVSHICHEHDHSWEVAENTFLDFLISNLVFLFNLCVYLLRDGSTWLRIKRFGRILLYVGMVSTIGWSIFKNLKKQEHSAKC